MEVGFYLVGGIYTITLFLSFFSKNKYIHPWGTLILIVLPLLVSVLSVVAREKTGCSEYKQFRSEYCCEASADLGINLVEFIFLSEFLSYLVFTFVSIPAFVFLAIFSGVSFLKKR